MSKIIVNINMNHSRLKTMKHWRIGREDETNHRRVETWNLEFQEILELNLT